MTITTVEADALCDASFSSPFNWERNYKGNLWRRWRGKVLTVFKQGTWCSWCINDNGAPTYSPRSYSTEEEAIAALLDNLRETEM